MEKKKIVGYYGTVTCIVQARRNNLPANRELLISSFKCNYFQHGEENEKETNRVPSVHSIIAG